MIAKCPCEHCGENIEFASEEFHSGSSVVCPHCSKGTTLYVGIKPAPKPAAPVIPPPKNSSRAAYPQKSSMKFLPWIIVAVLVVVSGFLAVNFSHEHAHRILLESQLAAVEEKLNALQANAAGANRAAAGAEIKQQLVEAKQDVRDAVAGIYEFDPGRGMYLLKMDLRSDLRSDGTGITYKLYHGEEISSRKTTWSFGDNKITVDFLSSYNPFTPEGDDLIDSSGNRWIRTH